jgi:hypothetical protein
MKARDNPFRSDAVLKVRYRMRGTTWDQALEQLKQLNYRAGIVGPEGSGKTTLLEDVQAPLQAMGWRTVLYRLDDRSGPQVYWKSMLQGLSGCTPNDLILLDGAEQLTPFRWRRLRRYTSRLGGLIVTVHHPGRLPTWIHCQTDGHLLLEIIRELLGVNLPGDLEWAHDLCARHSGNLRAALRELYDRYASGQCR